MFLGSIGERRETLQLKHSRVALCRRLGWDDIRGLESLLGCQEDKKIAAFCEKKKGSDTRPLLTRAQILRETENGDILSFLLPQMVRTGRVDVAGDAEIEPGSKVQTPLVRLAAMESSRTGTRSRYHGQTGRC